jgi:hypothetical protein
VLIEIEVTTTTQQQNKRFFLGVCTYVFVCIVCTILYVHTYDLTKGMLQKLYVLVLKTILCLVQQNVGLVPRQRWR